jgi:hypothetical protein
MLMLLAEENGFHGMPPDCGGETRYAARPHDGRRL